MTRAGLGMLVLLAGCHLSALEHMNSVYFEGSDGYSVERNWRHSQSGNLWPVQLGDVGEPGVVNPGVIEFVFAAAESPLARYYELVLSLPHRPRAVDNDLGDLRRRMASAGVSTAALTGRDYAGALGRKLAGPVNEALSGSGLPGTGIVGVLWGMPVDLDAGVPLVAFEHEGVRTMQTTLLRYESVALLLVHSDATQEVLAWDLRDLPGAFQATPLLGQATIAAHIVALHPGHR